MRFKITFYDNYFCREITKVVEEEYETIDILLNDYGVEQEHMEEVKRNLQGGMVVVYDECGDKTSDPQFHSPEGDMVFKVEEVKIKNKL